MWGTPHEFTGTSFEITVLTDLLYKLWTFPLMWGPHREFTCPISFEITVLPDNLI